MRIKASLKHFLLLFIFLNLSLSIGEEIIVAQELTNGEEVYLGKVARGQVFSIFIDPIVEEGGKYGEGGRYDLAYAKDLPPGWSSKNSSLYGNPLEVVVYVPKDAEFGFYEFTVFVKDEGKKEGLDLKWFKVKVEVVKDSSSISSSISSTVVGLNNPVNVRINIKNKVDFGNLYEVSVFYKNTMEKKIVYVEGNGEKELLYSFSYDKEGTKEVRIEVKEQNNPDSLYLKTYTIEVRENLVSEYRSIGEGIMIVPIFQALPYYLLYLLSLLIPS